VLSAARPAGALSTAPLDVTSYRAQIDRLVAAIEAGASDPRSLKGVADSLPPVLVVRAEQQEFSIPVEWLRDVLRRQSLKADRKALAALRSRLLQLRADLDAFEAPPAATKPLRQRLDAILARPEFSNVRGPGWFDHLKQRVLEFLAGLLVGIWGSSSFPAIANAIVWTLVGLAVLVTAVWIYRSVRRASTGDAPAPDAVPVSAKPWTEWLAEARAAAAAGLWHDAVRLAYWSGISWLESGRVWSPDRARTPREYLRLLPDASQYRPALASLTRTFELTWYASQPSDESTFSRAVEDLERLGCRPS